MRFLTAFKSTVMFIALIGASVLLATATMTMQFHRSLPHYNAGYEFAKAPGVASILRDQYAIPHIEGENDEAVYFGLGVAHAQDRLWQMEISRRIIQGRFAELIGARALDYDLLMRNGGLYEAAGLSLQHLSPETIAALQSYADGVNAVIRESASNLPPEFLLLHVRPEPWKPQDSLAVMKLMSVGLSTNMYAELLRFALSQELTMEQIKQALPPYPGDESHPLPHLPSFYSGILEIKTALNLPYDDLEIMREASNNWVVSGALTYSGKTMLANDPHLGFSAPSIWYLAHLKFKDRNVIGASIPGFPAILLGRNDHIAWGFTNTGPDTQDLYLEKLNPENDNEYLTPEGWQEFETTRHRIPVRFSESIEIETKTTRHGPVISIPSSIGKKIELKNHVLSLAWTGYSRQDTTTNAAIGISKAKNWEEARDALRDFHVPMQNIVISDIAGNIAFVAPGAVPIRRPDHDTQGLSPSRGWLAKNDWQGFIPFDELPLVANPPDGMIVTANQKTTPENYQHHITYDWGYPFRARRIADLITSGSKHDDQSFSAIQNDNYSGFAALWMAHASNLQLRDPQAASALERLKKWDHVLNSDRPEGLIFWAWVTNFWKHLYEDELGNLYGIMRRGNPFFAEKILANDPDYSSWCDNTETSEVTETCNEVLERSLIAALQELQDRYGKDPANWNWGEAHTAIHAHRPFDFVPGLRNLFSIENATGGGPFSPNQGGIRTNGRYRFGNVHGAAYRAVYDFSDLNKSRYVQSTGQSGHPFSTHFADLNKLWAQGELIPASVTPSNYTENSIGTVSITP